jgi:hypothetical protein
VSRAGLIEAAHASDCRVIGVTAPAGYGKPTFTGAPTEFYGTRGDLRAGGMRGCTTVIILLD